MINSSPSSRRRWEMDSACAAMVEYSSTSDDSDRDASLLLAVVGVRFFLWREMLMAGRDEDGAAAAAVRSLESFFESVMMDTWKMGAGDNLGQDRVTSGHIWSHHGHNTIFLS